MTREEWKKIYELGLRIVAKFDEVQPGFYDRLWKWPKGFLATASENWTVEEFLEWQRESSRPNAKHNLGRMVEKFERSRQFKQLIGEVRQEHGINVELMRGMTRKECEVWAMYSGQPDPYYRWGGSPLTRHIYAIMDDYELARAWYRYVLSWVVYGEGSAGFNTLSNVCVVLWKINPVTREWNLELEVSADVEGYEVEERVNALIPSALKEMLGERAKMRVRGPRPLWPQELWVKLYFDKGKSVEEIYHMMRRLREQIAVIKDYYQRRGRLLDDVDAHIREIYEDQPVKDVVDVLDYIADKRYSKSYISKAIRYASTFPPTYKPPDLPPDELEKLARKPPDLSF